MLCRDMIKLMEKMIAENEPHLHILGEAEVVIDVFRSLSNDPESEDYVKFHYVGFSPDVKVQKSADGVYDILSAFDDEGVREG